MPRRRFSFETPDRFITGTVGQPGSRVFFLQARAGGRITSVALEKLQVAALADRLGDMLDELARRGTAGAEEVQGAVGDTGALDEPVIESFRVGTLTLAWDSGDDLVIIEARAFDPDDDEPEMDADPGDIDVMDDIDDDDGPDILRVRITAAYAREFIARALRVLAAGRPPCPLCGQPLDPQGHICPRRNGHLLN
jgi:uncharacterized repeat protein (TIGR03847 family)